MILYGAPVSPFVRKVCAYLSERNLEFEQVFVGLGDPNPGFLAASPFRKMPALTDGDYQLSDSSAIIHYLEAKHPEGGLIPADPQLRGKSVWLDEFGDTIVTAAAGKMFFNRVVSPRFLKKPGDDALAAQGEAEMLPVCDYLERIIPESGFLVGDRLTLADLATASPFVNASHAGFSLDGAAYPKLMAYLAAILARPCFASGIASEKAMLGIG